MLNDKEKMREAIANAHRKIQEEYIANESLSNSEKWVALGGKIEVLDSIANEVLANDDELISEISKTKKVINSKQKK